MPAIGSGKLAKCQSEWPVRGFRRGGGNAEMKAQISSVCYNRSSALLGLLVKRGPAPAEWGTDPELKVFDCDILL